MARLLGPEPTQRAVWKIIGGVYKSAVGALATFYTDAQGTMVADIRVYDPLNPSTVGAVIAGAQVAVGYDSMLPIVWYPNAVDTLYVSIDGGGLQLACAAYDHRLDTLETTVAAINLSGYETTAGSQAKANAAQAAAIAASDPLGSAASAAIASDSSGSAATAQAAAATDATTKATAAQAAATGAAAALAIVFGG